MRSQTQAFALGQEQTFQFMPVFGWHGAPALLAQAGTEAALEVIGT